jgi:hypothetical protein
VINRLIPLNDDHVKAVDDAREQLWSIYHGLKAYKLTPVTEQADSIKQRFQTLSVAILLCRGLTMPC